MSQVSYPTALKTLKHQLGNPNSVATAYVNDMLNSTYVPSNDRQALRDYYDQVKALEKLGNMIVFKSHS